MRISSLEEYGLRCALQLARFKVKNELAAASVIAEKEGLSVEYVSKIMHLFRRGGLVQSTRGIQGGFALARAPAEVTLKNVLEILAVSQKSPGSVEGFCGGHTGMHAACVHQSTCNIKPVWTFVFDVFDRVLSGITLADLMAGSVTTREIAQQLLAKKLLVGNEEVNESVRS